MKKENVKLNFEKCKFAQLSVKYLGHELTLNEIRPLHCNIESILKLNNPTNLKQLRRFLGKVNYNRKFIPRITEILEPLHKLLRKENKFEWNDDCQKSFEKLKQILTTEPVLKMYNPKNEIILETDASKIGVGAVLKQVDADKNVNPIGYFSKKLSNYQQNYPATHLECLAVIEAIKFWHCYLCDKRFTIITDHSALTSIRKMKNPNSRLFTWALFLGQYDFEIKYRPGTENVVADYLSRDPISNENIDCHVKLVNFISLNEMKNEQIKMSKLDNSQLVNKNGLLVKLDKNGFEKIIVPENLREKLMQNVHDQFGHVGVSKMLTILGWLYTWPKMTENVITFVSNCLTCQAGKTKRVKQISDLGQFGPAKLPFEIVSIDTICGLDGYKCKKKYIHLAIDNFTRFVWAIASHRQTFNEFINLMNNVMKMGKPSQILADRYTAITSDSFGSFLNENEIKINFIPKSAPQSNGLCERVGNTIVDKIRTKMIDSRYRCGWVKFLKRSVEEYNHTPHSVTGFTPYYLLNGTLPQNCENVEWPSVDQALNIAYENSKNYHEKNKILFGKHHKLHEFSPNDSVFIKNLSGIRQGKLDPLYYGPYKISKKIATNIYEIIRDENPSIAEQIHAKHLIPTNLPS